MLLPEVHHYHCIHEPEFAEDLSNKIEENGPYQHFLVESPAPCEKQDYRSKILTQLLGGASLLDYIDDLDDAGWLPKTFDLINNSPEASAICIDGDFTRLNIDDYDDEIRYAAEDAVQLANRDILMANQVADFVSSEKPVGRIAVLTGASHSMVTPLLRMTGLQVKRILSPENLDEPKPHPLGRMVRIQFNNLQALQRQYAHGLINYGQFSEKTDALLDHLRANNWED